MTVYQIITDRIIKILETGTIPWHKPWNGGGLPKNIVSGKSYRGINVWMLASAGYASPYWVSFKQALELGGSVRKGERGMPVVFWMFKKDEDEASETHERQAPILRYYTVFNVSQCDGLKSKRLAASEDAAPASFEPIAECDRIAAAMPQAPALNHGGESRAYYRPSTDTVSMPARESFPVPAEYYSTLFHELGHATGHSSRLNRSGITELAGFGTQSYSREELVAEMTAAFLCGIAGIENTTIDNSAAYIKGWASKLGSDPTLIVTAAAQAQKASDFILNVKWEN